MTTELEAQPQARQLDGMREFALAIDAVIALASRQLRIFDRNLSEGGYNTPDRFNRLKVFLLASRKNRIDMVVHSIDYLERQCPRMMILLRQFPYAVSIYRTGEEAKHVYDGFVIADDRHYVRRFHFDQPRGALGVDDESEAGLLVRRFEEIWGVSEPALTPTVLGL
jgi:hypothetical protein